MRMTVKKLKQQIREAGGRRSKEGAHATHSSESMGWRRSKPTTDGMNNLEFIATLLFLYGPLSRRDVLAAHQLRKGIVGPGGKLEPGYGSSYFSQRGGMPQDYGWVNLRQYASGSDALWTKNEEGKWELTEDGQDYVRHDKAHLIDVYIDF